MKRRVAQPSRRQVLRGAGIVCLLPYMEAFAQEGQAPLAPAEEPDTAPRRLAAVYFPNGCSLPAENDEVNGHWRWFPHGGGRDWQFTRVLESLEPFRERLSVFGGLSHPLSRELLGHMAGDSWLTAGDLRGDLYQNRISVDQVVAHEFKKHTRYPSLVMSTDGGVGYKSRVSTLSFNHEGRPIPSEHKHRSIFERYFAPAAGATTAERKKSLAAGKKIVNLALEDSKNLAKQLGQGDRDKLDEYLTSLNSVEEQIRRSESWLDRPLGEFDASHIDLDADPGVDPTNHLRTHFDLLVLAFQLDLTRVATFMMGREDGMGYGDRFPSLALGINRGHHTISHDTHEGHWDQWGPFDQWFAQQFTYFIDRLSKTEDAHGPLLDRTTVLYGGCCSTTHNARNYPLLVAGGNALGLQHGQYHRLDEHTPFSNLLLTLMHAMGVKHERFADSTGLIPGVLA